MRALLPRALLSWPTLLHTSLCHAHPNCLSYRRSLVGRSPGRGPPLGELSTVAYLGFRLCHLFFWGGLSNPSWPQRISAGAPALMQQGRVSRVGLVKVGPPVRALTGAPLGQKGFHQCRGSWPLGVAACPQPKDVLLKGCSCQIPVGLQADVQRSYILPPTPAVFLPSFLPFHR